MPSDAPTPAGLPMVTGIGMGVLIMFVLVALLIVGVFFLMLYTARRRWQAARAQGLDPVTADIQIMSKLNRSVLLAPRPEHAADAMTARLAELDELRDSGTLSADEYTNARAKIIEEI